MGREGGERAAADSPFSDAQAIGPQDGRGHKTQLSDSARREGNRVKVLLGLPCGLVCVVLLAVNEVAAARRRSDTYFRSSISKLEEMSSVLETIIAYKGFFDRAKPRLFVLLLPVRQI